MFLQTFMLALTARGVGSCPDPDFAANVLDVPRSPLADSVTFLED